MKVLIDIYHLPQFNFFKPSLLKLKDSVDLRLCTVRRGRQVEVIRNDCPDFPLNIYGDYKKNKGFFSFVFKVVLPRIYRLWQLIRKEKFQLVVTANYQANIAARLLGIPSIGFNDDPEKINLKILKLAAKEVYLPVFAVPKGKTRVFKALKEWAYLSPDYFTPRRESLEPYGLEPGNYIFIREVTTKSLNYRNQPANCVLTFAFRLPPDYPVVLSLEDKSARTLYPEHWIVLEEPVEDIHSLMYFSKMVISSGDSMAREGAMLGVPGIYCGIREMAANRVLIEKQMLYKVPTSEVPEVVHRIISGELKPAAQDTFRARLREEWDDVTALIVSIVKRYNGGSNAGVRTADRSSE
jgi:predicted glycosyltransferase